MTDDLLDLIENGTSARGRFHFADGRTRTTKDLWASGTQYGRSLRRLVGSDGHVAVILTPCPEALSFLLGGLLAGLTVASLPLPARGMQLDRYLELVKQLATSAGASLVAVEDEYRGWLDIDMPVFGFSEFDSHALPANLEGGGTLMQFSSGTTADPKGIALSLDAIGANVRAILSSVNPQPLDRSLSWLPLSHDMGLIGMCLVPWAAMAAEYTGGGDAWLLRPEDFLARPLRWITAMADQHITVSAAPCFALNLVSRRARREPVRADLSRLRSLIIGAEPVIPDVLRDFERTADSWGLASTALSPSYGLAEATLAVSMSRPEETWQTVWLASSDGILYEPAQADAPGSQEFAYSGRPIPDVDVRLDDGRLEIASAGLGRSCAPSGNPLAAEGWFRTNDVGWLDEKGIVVAGRVDDVLVVRGRSFDGRRFAAVADQRPYVRAGTAVALTDEQNRLCIVAELAQEASRPVPLELEALRRDCAQEVGLSPERIILVRPGEVQKTPSGKLKRHSARVLLAHADSTDDAT